MEEASAGTQGPENCCSSSPCRFVVFVFFLLIPFLLRISDAGSMTLRRTALVVYNILKKDSIESGKRESKKQKKGDKKRRWKIVGERSTDKEGIFCKSLSYFYTIFSWELQLSVFSNILQQSNFQNFTDRSKYIEIPILAKYLVLFQGCITIEFSLLLSLTAISTYIYVYCK